MCTNFVETKFGFPCSKDNKKITYILMLVILVHVDIDISELETSLKLLVYNHFHSTALIILDLQMREMLRSNPTLANCTPFLHWYWWGTYTVPVINSTDYIVNKLITNSLVFCERKSDSLPSLFCLEWPEGIAHGHSFVMSNLSESIAHSRSFVKSDGRKFIKWLF